MFRNQIFKAVAEYICAEPFKLVINLVSRGVRRSSVGAEYFYRLFNSPPISIHVNKFPDDFQSVLISIILYKMNIHALPTLPLCPPLHRNGKRIAWYAKNPVLYTDIAVKQTAPFKIIIQLHLKEIFKCLRLCTQIDILPHSKWSAYMNHDAFKSILDRSHMVSN